MTKDEAREILIERSRCYKEENMGHPLYIQAIDCAIQALGDEVKLTDWQKGWLSFNLMDCNLVEKILNSNEPPKPKQP